ncbi:MAG: outer membrane protein OmpA-like peptidoglycan-associated protein [Patiriisocius sp.]|jgi:outer membrane protein OmpA-like peptidoglycan-associated protein
MSMIRKVTLLLLASAGIIQFATAQIDLIMYNLDGVPQNLHVNPSAEPSNRFYIGFPGLSSIHLHQQNTFLNPFHLLKMENGVSTVRTAHFADRLKNNNTIGIETSIELLSFGFKQKKNYFHFSVKDRASASVHLPKDLLRFPITGNGRFDQLDDNTLDFTDLAIDADHFMEFSIGWQRNIFDKWSVGARFKYLKGFENVRTVSNDILWKTDPTTFDWTISGQMDIMSSGIYENIDSIDDNSILEREEFSEYFSSKKNSGFGVDLGATYHLNEKLDLSLSILDLGFINWKTDTRNYTSADGEFVFAGLQLSSELYGTDSTVTDSLEAVLDDLADDVENSFGYAENTSSYKTSLRSRIYLNANYNLYTSGKTSGSVGLTAQGKIRNKSIHPSLTLSYNQKVGKWMAASIAYSMINNDYKNLGAGLRLNGGPFQWYVTVDNLMPSILTEVNVISEGTNDKIVYPSFSENAMVHTGINFTFGKKAKDTDDDGIPDKKDTCPDIPGKKEFDGCPDTDGDGLSDNEDDCPEDAGPKELKGCPDTDGDTVIDKRDVCPELAGPVENNGCPDKDMDGVLDNEDECPEIAGPVENKGCPWSDRDTDGIMDNEDECPDEPGPLANGGCPYADRDGDGVPDDKDNCPDVAGVVENNGCPIVIDDKDSDGVPDAIDECPNTYGSKENNGCPKVSEEDQNTLATTFNNVEFESNTAVITQESYPSIDKLITILKENPDWKLKVSGHTDSIGGEEANLKLSKKRAQTVADLITERGISRGRLDVIAYSESQPIESNMYNPGRQKNRRVELEFVFD